jgi:hypothetical protein
MEGGKPCSWIFVKKSKLKNRNKVVYRIMQQSCKRIFTLFKVSFYANILAAHHLSPWKKCWRRPLIEFYIKNQLSSSSPSIMKLLLNNCQLTMRLIPEAAHCGSVGHVLRRVMCIDKLKLLCKYWVIYRVGHEKVARLPFCTCPWLLY